MINLKRACSPMPAILPFTTQEISTNLSSAVRFPPSAERKGRTVAHTPTGPSAYRMVLNVRLEPGGRRVGIFAHHRSNPEGPGARLRKAK